MRIESALPQDRAGRHRSWVGDGQARAMPPL